MRFLPSALILVATLSALAKSDMYTPVSIADLETGDFDNIRVEFTGVVDDAFRDEIDRRFVIFAINDRGHTTFISQQENISDQALAAHIGATVRIRGNCSRYHPSNRRQHEVQINFVDSLEILEPAPRDVFSAPRVCALTNVTSAAISLQGRHSAYGQVMAVWDGDRILLLSDTGEQCIVQFRQLPPPTCGAFVEVVGLPETDFFRVHLVRALWRPAPAFPTTPSDIRRDPDVQIVTREGENTVYAAELYGQPVCIRGIVRSLPTADHGTLTLECEDAPVSVDTGSVPEATKGLQLGATVEATGICIFDVDTGRSGSVFPRIRGYRLVLRSKDDLVTVRPPPWWTPARLLVVIAVLLFGLTLLLVRTAILRRIARLRLEDRTRLAIDLHDSVSQNLTSVLMQIDAARQLAQSDADRTSRRLDIASKTVYSCRMELRNCIRDLRDNALDLDDLQQAIRTVLTPHLADAELVLRFNVPRHRLSDNVTHAVLRILRELVANAVRHGRASKIRVAGALDGDRLLFSVTDNGCGFDPAARPGVADGHFGLAGVAERIRALGGELRIDSAAGNGARISVTLPRPLL